MENSGLTAGMGKHRDVNSYYYPEVVRVTTGDWHFHNYDLDGRSVCVCVRVHLCDTLMCVLLCVLSCEILCKTVVLDGTEDLGGPRCLRCLSPEYRSCVLLVVTWCLR
jgi:hypothetical protein